jgi:hypothetical protein
VCFEETRDIVHERCAVASDGIASFPFSIGRSGQSIEMRHILQSDCGEFDVFLS